MLSKEMGVFKKDFFQIKSFVHKFWEFNIPIAKNNCVPNYVFHDSNFFFRKLYLPWSNEEILEKQ